MRSANIAALCFLAAGVLWALITSQSLQAQTPHIGGGVYRLVDVSLKTEPEHNRKVVKQIEAQVTIEKGEKSIFDVVESLKKQAKLQVEVCDNLFNDIDALERVQSKIRFPTKLVNVSAHTVLRVFCEQLDAAYWVADDRVFIIPMGRPLNKVIQDAISAKHPVEPWLVDHYVDQLREKAKGSRASRMVELLAAPVDVGVTKEPLRDVLSMIRKQYGLNVLCNRGLNAKRDGKKDRNPLDAVITLPEMKRVRLDRLLRIVLEQGDSLDFTVTADHIEVFERVHLGLIGGGELGGASRLRVHVAFDDIPLQKAVDELIEQTNQSIVIKLPEAARRKLVTLTALDESFDSVLKLLALQVGAEIIKVDRAHVLTVKDK